MGEGSALNVGVVEIEEEGGEDNGEGDITRAGGAHTEGIDEDAIGVVGEEEEGEGAGDGLRGVAAEGEDDRGEE